MDIRTIEAAIQTLENDATTVETVSKLSALYICRANLKNSLESKIDGVEQELEDVLPCYQKYKAVKKKYQLNQALDGEVIHSLKNVCIEIQELIEALYSGSDMHRERLQIKNMIKELQKKFSD